MKFTPSANSQAVPGTTMENSMAERVPPIDNSCVICGEPLPENVMVCAGCVESYVPGSHMGQAMSVASRREKILSDAEKLTAFYKSRQARIDSAIGVMTSFKEGMEHRVKIGKPAFRMTLLEKIAMVIAERSTGFLLKRFYKVYEQ